MKNQNSFLKKVCCDLAEIVLAARYDVTPDELYDEDGCFHQQYQDVFNRLYDFAEGQMKHLVNVNMKSSEIYTTGAFLTPVTVMDCNGDAIWMWAVSRFEDDSYCDGKICNPAQRAERDEDLLLSDSECDEKTNNL
jgi:hypothetical protein